MKNILATVLQQLKESSTVQDLYRIIFSHGSAALAQYDQDGEIRTISYDEYDRRIRNAAVNLQSLLGADEQPRFVGIRLENSPDYITVLWSVFMAGYQPALLDAHATEAQTEYLLGQLNAQALITDEEIAVPQGVTLLRTEQILKKSSGTLKEGFGNMLAVCTSGTTSTSKVYVYDGQALVNTQTDFFTFMRINPNFMSNKPVRILAFLPFHHIFGIDTLLLTYPLGGKTLIFLQRRTPDEIQRVCQLHQVTHLFNVPVFWNAIAQKLLRAAQQKGEGKAKQLTKIINSNIKAQRLPGFLYSPRKNLTRGVRKQLLGSHLHCCISGGGRILPETLKILNGIDYPIVNGFGMTELGVTSVQSFFAIDDQLSGCVGRSMKGVKYKVRPTDPKNPSVGELMVKSTGMHIGRMVDGVMVPPELDEEGYFATGDIARLDNTGRMWLEGRLKEVIINETGENIYPDELEDAFAHVEGLSLLTILGVDFGRDYEDITMVVYAPEAEKDQNKLEALISDLAAANAQLPINKRIRRCFVTASPLPMTASMKVKRSQMRIDLTSGRVDALEIDLAKRRIRTSVSAAQTAGSDVKSDPEYQEILATVKRFFSEELLLPLEDITDKAHFIYDLGGDSLASLGVFTKVEEHFGLMIDDEEYTRCTCAEDAALLIHSKKHGSAAQTRRRIANFTESREWEALSVRLDEAQSFGNPYFVPHDSIIRDTSVVKNKEVINYGSYNYLCMSGHPRTVKAAQEAAEKYGTSASGSRLLGGEKTLHKELEAAIAQWKHTEAALALVSGHATNVTFVGNFCNQNDLILYDALIHNSVTQGCQLSQSKSKAFPHNDYKALESILRTNRDQYEKVLIVVEGVYSMDGDIAPIPEFVRLKKEYGCFLMVDEAHSSCVIGEHGGGVDEYFNLAPDDIDIKMGTLSKGLGTCGGYLAGKYELIQFCRYNIPGFLFSVGLSPVLAAASLEAVRIMQEEEGAKLAQNLHQNIQDFIEIAHSYGFDTCLAGESAVAPILIGEDADAYRLSNLLLEEGVFVPPAVYPAVPQGQARLRFCLTSSHTRAQSEKAMAALDRLAKEHGFNIPRKQY